MTFFARGPIGGWQYGDTLSHLAMSYVDSDHVDALDAVCGGTYALVTSSGSRTGPGSLTLTTLAGKSVTINSAVFPSASDGGGLVLGGEANVDTLVAGGVTVNGSQDITGSLTVPAIYSQVVNASTVVNTDQLNVNALSADHGSVAAGLSVGGTLDALGATDLHGAVTARAGLSVTAGVTNTKNLVVTGSMSTTGNVGVSGQVIAAGPGTFSSIYGRRVLNTAVGGNVNATYLMTDYDLLILYLSSTTMTANRTYTIDATGAQEGSSMRIWCGQSTHFMIIHGAIEGDLSLQYTTGNSIACTAVFLGGSIHLVDIQVL